ncbi:MAG: PIN domain-containing protein [Myxococcota bacterium]|jgi:predicted nucleic acid-binding protein|nr:PIN domain-containing protein [Myxococcota bacterium]
MPIAAVVGDANVLLSAVIGKAALRIFTEFEVEVHLCEFNALEVREYLPRMASEYGIPLDLAELQLQLLPLRLHPETDYADRLEAARDDLADRDPDDAHPLALSRSLGLPLWTNDRDLDGHGVECFSTARLLKVLEPSRGPQAGT